MPNNISFGVGAKGVGKASSDVDRLRDKFDKLQKQGAKGFGLGVGAAAGLTAFSLLDRGASMAVDAIGGAIEASSNLNEQVSKSRVVFGGASSTVEAFGDKSAKSLGLSKRAALEAAGTFGNFFTGLGKGQDEAAQMSTSLVTLAGDLASFNNMDPTDMLDRLRSGLSGEAEPLRRVGVFLTEAKVKAKAMELGLAGAHGELSEGAKVMARYALIMDETKTAQGDFARTADSMANQQRILNAQLEDTGAALGVHVVPVVIEGQKAVIGLFDAFEDLNSILGANDVLTKDAAESSADLLGTLGLLMPGYKLVADAAAGMGNDTDEAADKASHAVDEMKDGTVDNLDKMEDAAKDWRDTWHDVTGETIRRTNAMRDKMVDAAGDISDDFFDPIETRADIFDAHQATLAAIEAQRLAKNKKQHREASRDIVSSLDDQADGLHDLSRQGKITEKDVDKFEADVKASYKSLGQKVPAELQRIIDRYRAIARLKPVSINLSVQQGTRTSPRDTHAPGHGKLEFAEGGRVPGAKGAPVEATLHGGEFVVSNDMQRDMGSMGSGGRGAGVNYYVTVNAGAASGLTAGSARELANQLGPAIYADMQRRGLLPRGGMGLRG